MTRLRRASTRRASSRSTVTVDEYDNVVLLRSSVSAQPRPEDVAEFARSLGGGDEDGRGVSTIVVGAEDADSGLWTRLGAVLDSLRDRKVTAVRLALSGAGTRHRGRPAMAQRIADAWGFEVIAPDASVLIVPGGSLFALGPEGAGRGWWSFTPGAEPTLLGPRSPAPRWQAMVTRLPGRTAGGNAVEQVPAGIFVRPANAPRTSRGDLCYAVPIDGTHATVIVDASPSRGGPGVPAEDIAALLAALPDTTRSEVRLAPSGPDDLLPLGQETAELLGAEVEVLTGLPLLVDTDSGPEVRPVLIGPDAEPTWAPFVEAVAARPYATDGSVLEPRLVRWRSPLPGDPGTSPAVPLSGPWQVGVTRAGLTVGRRGDEASATTRPVSAERLAVEVNLGDEADDTLFDGLSRLLSGLDADTRKLATIHQTRPPNDTGEDDFRLLRLAIQHGVALTERPTAETAKPPATPNVQTVTAPRPRPTQDPTPTPTAHPPEPAEELRATLTDGPDGTITPAPEAPLARNTRSPAAADPAKPKPPPPAPDNTAKSPHGPLVPSAATPPYAPLAPEDGPTPADPGSGAPEARPAAAASPERDSDGTRTPTGSDPAGAPYGPATPPSGQAASLADGPSEIPVTPVEPVAAAASPGRDPEGTRTPTGSDPAGASYAPEGPVAPGEPAAAASEGAFGTSVPDVPEEPAARVGGRPRVVAKPVRWSGEAERAEFRALAQPVWERHRASVNRAMTRMPALRGSQLDAARTDLVAVHLYLSGALDELGLRDAADGVPAAYTACLGSGLNRLPSYRGVAVRGGLSDGDLARFVPGGVLSEPGPLSALPIDAARGLPATAGGYVIWSSTGRRVRPLLGSAPGADEVVFPPGAVFRVLDVRSAGPAPTVLLVEVAGGASVEDRPGGLSDADHAALDRLDEALRRHASPDDGDTAARPTTWPSRYDTPLGEWAGAG